ncbi:MAG: type IV pilus modification protein PilV [Hydrogenophilales bacterium RIFOXYD1_FULL_62_11]|nr:MAG: type IV pilus modification protein PilV [Hydrogenophilales bacterium RIFOXYD1_FULL_62_11]
MRQKGFTLLEVMVAMLVLSIGLLGLAGLMASSLRNNHSAYYRSQATWLAYDVMDRMRTNRPNAAGYVVGIPGASAAGGLAGADVADWKAMIANALPEGDGEVAINAAGEVTVGIQWNDARGTGGDAAQKFTVRSRL